MKKSTFPTRSFSTLALTAIIASAPVFAYAAKDDDNKHGGRKTRGANIERLLEKMDINKDGDISLEEIKTKQQELFASVDANNDSSLSREEFNMMKEIRQAQNKGDKSDNASDDKKTAQANESRKKHKKRGKHGGKGSGHRFERLDKDNSGSLTLTEFTANIDKKFERMDRNEDGVLNADDIKRKKRG